MKKVLALIVITGMAFGQLPEPGSAAASGGGLTPDCGTSCSGGIQFPSLTSGGPVALIAPDVGGAKANYMWPYAAVPTSGQALAVKSGSCPATTLPGSWTSGATCVPLEFVTISSGVTIPAGTVLPTLGMPSGVTDLNVGVGAQTRVLVVPFLVYGSGSLLGLRTIIDSSGGTTAAVIGIYNSDCTTLLASKNLTAFNTAFYPTDFTFAAPLSVTPGRYYIGITTQLAAFNMSSFPFNGTYNGRLFSNTANPAGVVSTTGNARTGTGATLALPSSCGTLTKTDEFTNVPAPVMVF